MRSGVGFGRSAAGAILAIAALAAGATSAQTPKPGALATGPTSGGPISSIKTVALKVVYIYDPAWKITVSADPAVAFACVQGEAPPAGGDAIPFNAVVANTITCTARVSGTRLTIRVGRDPTKPGLPGIVISQLATGKQWGGACAGTTGSACLVQMRASPFSSTLTPRTVSVDWNSQP